MSQFWVFTKHSCNANCHVIYILKNVFIGKSNNTPASRFQCLLPGDVVSVYVIVISTIDFDDIFFFHANEVGDEWWDRMLPPEFYSAERPVA